MIFFSKGWGIKDRFSKHVMANISHKFYLYRLCNHCHTQAQQIKTQTVSNDVRLRRIRGSLIVICLIQREVISVNFVN